MEVVAAAASIAGLVTLVLQSVDGLVKFKEIMTDASFASKQINGLLGDINSLIQVLENVREVLEQFEAQKKNRNFAQMDLKLADCSRDIQVWLSTAKLLRPSGESGGKALLKKFRLAMNKDAIQAIKGEISRHRQIISLSLEVLGRTIDLDTSEQVYQLGSSMRQIENYSRASLTSSAQSIRDMDSIRSELSRLESMIVDSSRNADRDSAIDISRSPAVRVANDGDSGAATPTARGAPELHYANSNEPLRNTILNNAEKSMPEGDSTSAAEESAHYESSFLYASFSASTSRRQSHQPAKEEGALSKHLAFYEQLEQCLTQLYPACVADYNAAPAPQHWLPAEDVPAPQYTLPEAVPEAISNGEWDRDPSTKAEPPKNDFYGNRMPASAHP